MIMRKLEAILSSLLLVLLSLIRFDEILLVNGDISDSMYLTWGQQKASINADQLLLVLDQSSGSGAQTWKKFLFGSIEMLIKLVPGNSPGVVTANYMSSTGESHNEIDFEFLGNVSGQPYVIHTNLYVNGNGNREEQFYPWFDPTNDFHNYTIFWNPSQIVWFVDQIPIRVFQNYKKYGIPYPDDQGMNLYSSIWNGEKWATRGGKVKIDWNSAPFMAKFKGLQARACQWTGPTSITQCSANTTANWWASPMHRQLNYAQEGQLKWIRENFRVYNYCTDYTRFHGNMPLECSLNSISSF